MQKKKKNQEGPASKKSFAYQDRHREGRLTGLGNSRGVGYLYESVGNIDLLSFYGFGIRRVGNGCC